MLTKILTLNEELDKNVSYTSYSVSKTQKSEMLKRMESILKKAVRAELTERQRKCITYYYYDNKTVRDIAELLGIRPTTVYKHLNCARKVLKKCAIYL